MGVTGLWSILGELSERKDLGYLAGKRVAVDLSGWVVQAIQCKALTVKNPHLRNLFFRTSRLLEVGAFPIFVLEGKVPDLKQAAMKERNFYKKFENVSRPMFDRILNQCHDLLKSLGVPCIKSSGEAEAFCAVLCAKGIVDGVISEDSDTFLYGADTVFREFTSDPKDPHLRLYNLKSPKNKLHLDQRNMIGLALLLGCDYVKGVPGIGKEAAINLIKELNDCDLLQRFQDWKIKEESELFPGYDAEVKKGAHCTRCSHSGTSSKHKKEGCSMCDSKIICYINSKEPCACTWHKTNDIRLKRKLELKIYKASKDIPDFPNDKVIEEYLKFTCEIPEDEIIDWFCPNLKEFQEKAFNYLSWSFEYSFGKCFPIITSWQQFKLSKRSQDTDFLYKPIKVLKPHTIKGGDFLEIQWAPIDGDSCYDKDDKSLCSVESEERFKNSYPKIVEDYYKLLEEAKRLKKSKAPPKPKGKKSPPEDRKMTEFLSVASNTDSENSDGTKIEKSEDNGKRIMQDDDCYQSDCKRQCMTL